MMQPKVKGCYFVLLGRKSIEKCHFYCPLQNWCAYSNSVRHLP